MCTKNALRQHGLFFIDQLLQSPAFENNYSFSWLIFSFPSQSLAYRLPASLGHDVTVLIQNFWTNGQPPILGSFVYGTTLEFHLLISPPLLSGPLTQLQSFGKRRRKFSPDTPDNFVLKESKIFPITAAGRAQFDWQLRQALEAILAPFLELQGKKIAHLYYALYPTPILFGLGPQTLFDCHRSAFLFSQRAEKLILATLLALYDCPVPSTYYGPPPAGGSAFGQLLIDWVAKEKVALEEDHRQLHMLVESGDITQRDLIQSMIESVDHFDALAIQSRLRAFNRCFIRRLKRSPLGSDPLSSFIDTTVLFEQACEVLASDGSFPENLQPSTFLNRLHGLFFVEPASQKFPCLKYRRQVGRLLARERIKATPFSRILAEGLRQPSTSVVWTDMAPIHAFLSALLPIVAAVFDELSFWPRKNSSEKHRRGAQEYRGQYPFVKSPVLVSSSNLLMALRRQPFAIHRSFLSYLRALDVGQLDEHFNVAPSRLSDFCHSLFLVECFFAGDTLYFFYDFQNSHLTAHPRTFFSCPVVTCLFFRNAESFATFAQKGVFFSEEISFFLAQSSSVAKAAFFLQPQLSLVPLCIPPYQTLAGLLADERLLSLSNGDDLYDHGQLFFLRRIHALWPQRFEPLLDLLRDLACRRRPALAAFYGKQLLSSTTIRLKLSRRGMRSVSLFSDWRPSVESSLNHFFSAELLQDTAFRKTAVRLVHGFLKQLRLAFYREFPAVRKGMVLLSQINRLARRLGAPLYVNFHQSPLLGFKTPEISEALLSAHLESTLRLATVNDLLRRNIFVQPLRAAFYIHAENAALIREIYQMNLAAFYDQELVATFVVNVFSHWLTADSGAFSAALAQAFAAAGWTRPTSFADCLCWTLPADSPADSLLKAVWSTVRLSQKLCLVWPDRPSLFYRLRQKPAPRGILIYF